VWESNLKEVTKLLDFLKINLVVSWFEECLIDKFICLAEYYVDRMVFEV
jgi:hypothetical protein